MRTIMEEIEKIRIKADIVALKQRIQGMKNDILEAEKLIHSLQKLLLDDITVLPGQIKISAPITRLSSGGTVIIRKAKKENNNKKSNSTKHLNLEFDIPGIEI